jgi:hypothetical protein
MPDSIWDRILSTAIPIPFGWFVITFWAAAVIVVLGSECGIIKRGEQHST